MRVVFEHYGENSNRESVMLRAEEWKNGELVFVLGQSDKNLEYIFITLDEETKLRKCLIKRFNARKD